MSPFVSRQRLRPAGFIEPCLPSPVDIPPAGPDWLHEIKYDGFRMIALRRDDEIRLWSRNGRDWNKRFPLLIRALHRLRCRSCVIDAEVVAHNNEGIPDFKALRRREPPSLYAFDLLEINGIALKPRPI